jgi:ATP synthase protein I
LNLYNSASWFRDVGQAGKDTGLTEQTLNKSRTAAYNVLIIEAVITGFITLLLYISVNGVNAYSALLGGTVFIVPNFIFTAIVFWQDSGETAKSIVSKIYIGEAVKIFATIILFAGCFIMVNPVSAPAMLGTYMAMMICNLIGLSLQKLDTTENNNKEIS